MSSRYATMAEANWQKDAPDQYALIKDKPAFFSAIGAEAQRQVEQAEEASDAQAPKDETFQQRATRVSAVRTMVEEILGRELLTPPQPDEETLSQSGGIPQPDPETPDEAELRQALQDFQDARDEFLATASPEPTTS